MALDALSTSKPLSPVVFNPAYDMTYSRVTYAKGAMVLRMLEHAVGRTTFNTAVNEYLKAQSFMNANRSDIWGWVNLQAHVDGVVDSSLDLEVAMETWSVQAGYPVVQLAKATQGRYFLSQKRFFLNADDETDSTELWYIPLSVAYPGSDFTDTLPFVWMTEDTLADVQIEQVPFVLNVQETGYFRVNYEEDNWSALTALLLVDHEAVHKVNRAQLLDDSFNLARAGQLGYPVALGLAKYLSREEDDVPFQAGINSFEYLDLMFR